MATLKTIRKRIHSVKNTQKVTRAMQMIAAARLRKAQQAALGARAYARHARAVALRIAQRSPGGLALHPYLQSRREIRQVEFLVLTSDRGLCGGFNENLLRVFYRRWMRDQEHGLHPSCTVIGRKGRDYLTRREVPQRAALIGFYDALAMDTVLPVVEAIAQRFLAGETDHVVLVYNRFRNVIAPDITFEDLLPMAITLGEQQVTDAPVAVDYLYEPNKVIVVQRLIERALATQVLQAGMESVAAELAARMTAMDSASKNASEMIDDLTMLFNRARQASITKDLLDIVNGAEALKG